MESVSSPAHWIQRYRLALIIVVGLFLIWSAILFRLGSKGIAVDFLPPDLAPPTRSERIGYNWTLLDLDGRKISFERFRGKALLLNFGAPWCEPCLDELPSIDRLAANIRVKDVAIVFISTEDDRPAIRNIVKTLNLHIPTYQLLDSEAMIPFSGGLRPIIVLPTTYLIAPDGRVAAVQEGAAQWDAPEVIEKLETLSKTNAKEPLVR